MNIIFGEWRPDAHDENNALIDSKNTSSTADGYTPVKDLNVGTLKTADKPLHIDYGESVDGSKSFYIFSEKKIERMSTKEVTDVSIDTGYATLESWESLNFAGYLIATNFDNYVQKMDLSKIDKFSDLVKIKAKTMGVTKNFLVLGNVIDEDGHTSYKIRWSALGNPNDFTPSASTQSGFQNFSEGGSIVKVVGGDYATILCESAIYRMTYIGGALIFQFDMITNNVGCWIKESVIKKGSAIYFWSKDGLLKLVNGQVIPLGYGKINKWFVDNLDVSKIETINTVSAPNSSKVYWSFPNKKGGKYILEYDTVIDRFTYSDINHQVLGVSAVPATSLDDLLGNLDTDYPVSFDSKIYKGGFLGLFAVKNNTVCTFTGDILPATFKTHYVNTQQKTYASKVYPLLSDAVSNDISCVVGSKVTSATAPALSKKNKMLNGFIPVRGYGQYHSFEITTVGDFGKIAGIDVELKAGGR